MPTPCAPARSVSGKSPMWAAFFGLVSRISRVRRNWWGRGGGDRYDYLYSEAELREWLEKIRTMSRKARKTYVFFNNCHAGQAARNAKLMKELLSLPL